MSYQQIHFNLSKELIHEFQCKLLLQFLYLYPLLFYNLIIKMNKNNKTYYGMRAQVQTPQQIINNTQKELIQYIDHINSKIEKRIEKNQANFVVAFRNHIKKIQDQLSALKAKQQIQQRKYQSNKAITHLARQVSLFRQQAMRLSNQLEDTLQELQTANRLLKYKQSELRAAQSKLQQYMESNKRFQQQNNQIKSLIQEIQGQQNQTPLKNNINKSNDSKGKESRTCLQLSENIKIQSSKSMTKQSARAQYFLNNKLLGKYKFQFTNSLHNLTPKHFSNTARRTQIQKQHSLRNLSIQHPSPKASDHIKKESSFVLKQAIRKIKEKLEKSQQKDGKLQILEQLLNDQTLLSMIGTQLAKQKKQQKIPLNYISSDIMMKLNKFVTNSTIDCINKNPKKNSNKISQQKLAMKNRHHVLKLQTQRTIFPEKLQFTTL